MPLHPHDPLLLKKKPIIRKRECRHRKAILNHSRWSFPLKITKTRISESVSNLSRPFTAVAPPLDHRSRGSSPRWVSESDSLARVRPLPRVFHFPIVSELWTFSSISFLNLSLFGFTIKKKCFNFVAIDFMCRFRCSSSRWIQFKIHFYGLCKTDLMV